MKKNVSETPNNDLLLYVGSYTDSSAPQPKGIYRLLFDSTTGTIVPLDTIGGEENPSYIVKHPQKPWLYAVNELVGADGNYGGKVTAFQLSDQPNQSKIINMVDANGDAPCHLSITPDGDYLLIANYVSGNIAAFNIKNDGSLSEATAVYQHEGTGPNTGRQEGPHAHMIQAGAKDSVIYVADLGIDQILHYELAEGIEFHHLASTKVESGGGVRHFLFHPNLDILYALNELNSSVEVLAWENGKTPMKTLQSIPTTLTPETNGIVSPAAIKIHPNNQFLYTSNRGIKGSSEHSISLFHIDQDLGLLELRAIFPTLGELPRDFVIDPSGQFLLAANQGSNTINVFRINEQNGYLEATDQSYDLHAPVCLFFE